MSYLVLARKYRPRTFGEVIGQEVVTRVLIGALEDGRIGHAYLFAGPRGTGKTTIARVLAKCLNCEAGPTTTPCGTCERCLGADAGNEVDIIELDAASHTGVDTIRELRDEVAYAPMRARHKVYIIDEVHMLSKGAFNALLKTLEEPPPHVVFLFATTEPHKVPDTILSRCQVLRLAPIPEDAIAARLEDVFHKEDVRPGEGVVRELARSARGGMRDALSLADKLLALAGAKPSLEDLARLGGEGGAREVEELLDKTEAGDKEGLLRALAAFVGDEGELVAALLEALRTSVVLLHCGEDAPPIPLSDEERARVLDRGQRLGPDRLELWMQELLHARERMRILGGQERLILEITLLDLARPEATLPLGALLQRLEKLEQRLGVEPSTPRANPGAPGVAGPNPAAPKAPDPPPVAGPEPSPEPAKPPAPPPVAPAPTGRLASLWEPFLDELSRSHGALASLLGTHASAARLEEGKDSEVRIVLEELQPDEEKLCRDRRNQAACSKSLSRVAGRSLTVRLVAPEENPPAVPAEAPKSESTKDPFTQEVADLFGGIIEELP